MAQKRDTRQRRLVLEAVRSRTDHPTADDIYLSVREKDEKISRGTVYRNLSVLAEVGELTRVKAPAADRYDLRLDRHYHIFCTGCGAVFDAPAEYDGELDKMVENATGAKIRLHHTVFEGLCPQCREKGP